MPNAYIEETSVGADVTGDPVALWKNHVQSFSLHNVWTGTLSGTFTVEASNDPDADKSPSSVDWYDVSGDLTITSPAGSASSHIINASFGAWAYIRLKFTYGSGSGNLTTYLNLMQRLNVR